MKGDVIGGPIRWRMHIPVAPSAVFRALSSAEGRAAFWAESAPERDGVIHFAFVNGETYDAIIVEQRPDEVFAIEYFGGIARFELAHDGRGGTDVLLTHTVVGEEEWNEVHAGWLNVLFPLKAWLVGAIDLRNHDPSRSWNDGYADQ